jgi:Skp family chaperone for outer membrane proteins
VKIRNLIIATLAACVLAACGDNSPIGTIDVQRVAANWPKYQDFQNQLSADEQQIANSKVSNGQKARLQAALQVKYGRITEGLTQEIRDAAGKVSDQRKLKLVVTREGVGYGGVDITPDVEKLLNITEKATPTP